MCAKVSPSFKDENRELRKQIGCMNGIFQLFDRHHFPTRRRISSQNHKRPLPGAHHNIDPGHATKTAMEKDQEDARKESRVSFESSQTSCSSSCSSMLSSFDSNKTAQPEAISFIQIKIPVTPLQTTTMKEQNTSLARGQKSLDLRDVVKDSMYRETRGLSIKSKAKDERRCSVLKHIDSPRPSQQFKSGQSRVIVSDASSIQDICKLQEATKKYKDERLALPRFSYDERESRDTLKSTIQRKELPRLSLDSRASNMKSSALQSRSNFLLQDLHMGNENSSQVLPSNQDTVSNKRSSTVMAKLMGLEAFSDVTPTGESRIIKIKSCANIDSVSRSPKPAGMGKHTQDPSSPNVSQKDPASPHFGNTNSVSETDFTLKVSTRTSSMEAARY
ncbi:hypothetical protein Adt_25406 [Abeliophyllum distichum]|uniref:DUF3741 domain-containing protein n=1 Tax=Abeliophyllum distichum TaxID=126358 RepID=A0ABD1SGR7_9LAMI